MYNLEKDTQELTVEENGGSSTIELFDGDELIFKNGE